MANHKSALKRNRQSKIHRDRNRANKTRVKNVIKAVILAMEEGSADKAQTALQIAVPTIYKAATKNALHKKNASRKVSRLTRKVNAFVQGAQAAVA